MAEKHKTEWPVLVARAIGVFVLLSGILLAAGLCNAAPSSDNSIPSIFDPRSTPAESIRHSSYFVLAITGLIFLVVFMLLTYAVVKFRIRVTDACREPAQVCGSMQVELAWTIIPVLIVFVLFLATERGIHAIQDARKPATAVEVTAIGHQFWREFRYPALGIVTANELHVPVSDPAHPTPTFLKLLSADTDHSFWVPQLGGKTDLIPNRVNKTWIDPHERASTSANAPNTAAPNTRKCCSACRWTNLKSWLPRSAHKSSPQNRMKRRLLAGAFLKQVRA